MLFVREKRGGALDRMGQLGLLYCKYVNGCITPLLRAKERFRAVARLWVKLQYSQFWRMHTFRYLLNDVYQ